MINTIAAWNVQGFYFFNQLLGKSQYLDNFIVFMAEYFIVLLIVMMMSFVYQDFLTDTRARFEVNIIGLFGTLVGVLSVRAVIQLFYHHLRPFLALSAPHLFTESSYSFPSGHTIFIFGMATGMYFYNKKFSLFLFTAGVLVGIARIAAGVHYPFDIVGGAVLGIGTGLIVEVICRKVIFTKTQVEVRTQK